jgi:uncharacterized caspase-like protein
VIADSCHSGGLTRAATPDLTDADHARYVERAGRSKSRNLLSSGAPEPVSRRRRRRDHSRFAAALLRGLNAVDVDRVYGAGTFRDYIAVSVTGRSQQSPHVPLQNSGHDGGDFVFIRKNSP